MQAGVEFIQLDEPSFACRPDQPEEFLDLIARTVDGVGATISMHMCFGNYRGRAVGQRSYRPLFPHLAQAKVQQLALEFASREMAEIELAREIKPPMGLAVGLVDVKNTWIEPPELVAERLRLVLQIHRAGARPRHAGLRLLADGAVHRGAEAGEHGGGRAARYAGSWGKGG